VTWWHDRPGDPVLSDFRNLLYLVWKHLNLPDPTPAQYELALFLQHGWSGYATDAAGNVVHWYGDEAAEPDRTGWTRLAVPDPRGRSDILEAFRGIGKSYITSAYCLWKLLRDPFHEKFLVVSASSNKAKEFVAQTKMILTTMPLFEHLRPRQDQRDMVDRFDVNGASISQSPSVRAAGITGQITGSRATTIVADDIEVPDNSGTEEARLKLLHKVNEFDAIKVTGYSEVLFLGTPQTEESVYNRLIKERGYACFCWPARYPVPDKRKSYLIETDDGRTVDILAPPLRRADQDPKLAWTPTDPQRFDDYELLGREAKGKAFFALQYMLDTSLSDAERYPLKQHDLIVMAVNPMKAPVTLQWGHDSQGKNRKHDIPNVGFSGDYFLGPLFVDQEWRPYEQSVLFVDPSGRGKDETAWAIVKTLNGMFYVAEVGGIAGDPATAMRRVAEAAKRHQVNEIQVEPNYGGLVWITAFQPILAEVWPPAKPGDTAGCTVLEAEWSKAQKEARIIDTLEPVMTLHRLVVDERVARDQTLMYQLTHITRDRGSLTHDDRVDALAGAVAHFTSTLALDTNDAAKALAESEVEQALEDFAEAFNNMGSPVRRSRQGQPVYQVRL
jgi:hypothetical protein